MTDDADTPRVPEAGSCVPPPGGAETARFGTSGGRVTEGEDSARAPSRPASAGALPGPGVTAIRSCGLGTGDGSDSGGGVAAGVGDWTALVGAPPARLDSDGRFPTSAAAPGAGLIAGPEGGGGSPSPGPSLVIALAIAFAIDEPEESAWAFPTGGAPLPWVAATDAGGLGDGVGGGMLPEGTAGRATVLGARGDAGPNSGVWLPSPPEAAGGRGVAWGGKVDRSAARESGAAGSSTRGFPSPESDSRRSARNVGGAGGSRSTVLSGGWGAGATATRCGSAGARHRTKLVGGNPSDTSRMAAGTPPIIPQSQRERDTSQVSPCSDLRTFLPIRFASFKRPPGTQPGQPGKASRKGAAHES